MNNLKIKKDQTDIEKQMNKIKEWIESAQKESDYSDLFKKRLLEEELI